jgi:hypothetical protein
LIGWRIVKPPGTWTELLLLVFAVAGTTLFAAWKLGLGDTERLRFANLLKARWSRGFV